MAGKLGKYGNEIICAFAEFPDRKDRRTKGVRLFRQYLLEGLWLLEPDVLGSARINGDIMRIAFWYKLVGNELRLGWIAEMGGRELNEAAAMEKIQEARERTDDFYWKGLEPEYLIAYKEIRGTN